MPRFFSHAGLVRTWPPRLSPSQRASEDVATNGSFAKVQIEVGEAHKVGRRAEAGSSGKCSHPARGAETKVAAGAQRRADTEGGGHETRVAPSRLWRREVRGFQQ